MAENSGDRFRQYYINPLLWVEDFFGDNISLTTQQKEGMMEVGKLVEAKLKVYRGEKLTKEQQAYSKKIGISIMSGKGCHARGTGIRMFDGSVKNVEDVIVADKLMGDDSTPREVLSLARGREKMYRIKYRQNGEYYDVNESHILSLRCAGTHGKKYKFGNIKNITVKDYLKLNSKEKHLYHGYKSGVEYPERDLLIPPYILGTWLGDGCKTTTSIVSMDQEIIEEFFDYGLSVGLNTWKNNNGKEYKISAPRGGKKGTSGPQRNIFRDRLRGIGVWDNKHIPEDYMLASREQRLELLAGLLDTDGHLANSPHRKGNTCFTIIQKRRVIAEGIKELARSLGFNASLTPKIKSYTYKGVKKSGTYYEVNIGRGDTSLIPTRLKRKQACPDKKKLALNFSFDVIPLEIDDYYGFEITGNHLYLLEDYTVTHNTGKDFYGALVSLFFMMFNNMKGLGTANSAKQLRNVFWSEIAKVMSLSKRLDERDPQSPTILEELIEWQTEKIYMKHLKGKRWFMEAVTVPDRASEEDQAKALTGRHEDYMCFVIDEAAGMPDAVFSKLEGTLTGKLNLIVMIFNPVRRTGFAVRSQYEEKDKWVTLRWNSEESEIVNKSHIENLATYGKDSNIYRVDVLGLPPIAEADTLIPYDWVMDAIDRETGDEHDPVIKGVDVGAGGDSSIILTRQGGKVTKITGFNEADTMAFTGRVAQEILRDDPAGTFIDVIGVGKGVYDRLLEQGHNVFAVDVRRTARSDRYKNRRDELAQKVRKMFEDGTISIPNHESLIRQLISIKTKAPDSHGREVLESKKEMKRRIGHSPDEFDALCMSMAFEDSIFRSQAGNDAYDKYDDSGYGYTASPASWMGGG